MFTSDASLSKWTIVEELVTVLIVLLRLWDMLYNDFE